MVSTEGRVGVEPADAPAMSPDIICIIPAISGACPFPAPPPSIPVILVSMPRACLASGSSPSWFPSPATIPWTAPKSLDISSFLEPRSESISLKTPDCIIEEIASMGLESGLTFFSTLEMMFVRKSLSSLPVLPSAVALRRTSLAFPEGSRMALMVRRCRQMTSVVSESATPRM